MPARQASLLVADEIFYNLQGKAILQGIYHADLSISADPSTGTQLLFFIMAETDASDPFESFAVEITLPGSAPFRQEVPVVPPPIIIAASPGRTRFYIRHPVLMLAPILRPGRIEAKVIHEKGEIQVTAPWIQFNPPAQPTKPS
jgi:hypothetical protein